MIFSRKILALSALSMALSAQLAHADLSVQGGKLADASGIPIVMRGFTVDHFPQKFQTAGSLREIAATGSNTVKIKLDTSSGIKTSSTEIAKLVSWCRENQLIAVIETDNSQEDIAEFWLAPEVKSSIVGSEDYIIIDITEHSDTENLGELQKQTVQKLRNGGIRHTFLIDIENLDSKNKELLSEKANQLFASDRLSNTIFEAHRYQAGKSAKNSSQYMNAFIAKNLVLVMGEAADEPKKNASFIDTFLKETLAKNVGFFGWTWKSGLHNALTFSSSSFDESPDAHTQLRLLDGAGGIRESSGTTGKAKISAAGQSAGDIDQGSSGDLSDQQTFLLKAGKDFNRPYKKEPSASVALTTLIAGATTVNSVFHKRLGHIKTAIMLPKGDLQSGLVHIIARHGTQALINKLQNRAQASQITDPNSIISPTVAGTLTDVLFSVAEAALAAHVDLVNLAPADGAFIAHDTNIGGRMHRIVLKVYSACTSAGGLAFKPAMIHTFYPLYDRQELRRLQATKEDALETSANPKLLAFKNAVCSVNRPTFDTRYIQNAIQKKCLWAADGDVRVRSDGNCNTVENPAFQWKVSIIPGGDRVFTNVKNGMALCSGSRDGFPAVFAKVGAPGCSWTTDITIGTMPGTFLYRALRKHATTYSMVALNASKYTNRTDLAVSHGVWNGQGSSTFNHYIWNFL
jgi:hypothetical protein